MASEENGKSPPRKDRYWSVMLVGDRGRIIPFRHFKGIAFGVCSVSILLLAAFVTMSILYIRQGQTLTNLESELKNAKEQSAKLRDEKDLYLTKLMLSRNQEHDDTKETKKEELQSAGSLEPQKPEAAEPKAKPETKAVATPEPKNKASGQKEDAPQKPPTPKVKWRADIRRFSVSYDPQREVLNAQFRVYNMSMPKRRLSGRSVVVFKVQDDPPVKWLPVPRVQLKNEEPTGERGQVFRVKNYLTMKFRAYRQKAPIAFNTATVFVFSDDGRMLASKDFAFKIETPPPPKKPPEPLPAVVEQKSPASAPGSSNQDQADKQQQTAPLAPATEQDGSGMAAPNGDDKAAPGTGTVPPSVDQSQPTADKATTDAVDTRPSSGTPAVPSETQPQTVTPVEKEPTVNAPQPNAQGVPR